MNYRIVFLTAGKADPDPVVEVEAGDDDVEAIVKTGKALPDRSQAIVMNDRWTARYRFTDGQWKLAGDPIAVDHRPISSAR